VVPGVYRLIKGWELARPQRRLHGGQHG
jgi:hypothetical protein